MVSLVSLWLPILLSAVLVFIASSVMHMGLKYHNKDYHGFSNEDDVRNALNKGKAARGMYLIPYCASMKEMAAPEMQKKQADGPVGIVILGNPGLTKMGPLLLQWFLFSVTVSIIAAYLARHLLAPVPSYRQVFRAIGLVSFVSYGWANIPWSIWWRKPWSSTITSLIDAVIYGALTAGTFGWLWPRG